MSRYQVLERGVFSCRTKMMSSILLKRRSKTSQSIKNSYCKRAWQRLDTRFCLGSFHALFFARCGPRSRSGLRQRKTSGSVFQKTRFLMKKMRQTLVPIQNKRRRIRIRSRKKKIRSRQCTLRKKRIWHWTITRCCKTSCTRLEIKSIKQSWQ